MAFKIGDIVVLKSGSPKMTVTDVPSSEYVWTSWFAGAKNEKANFPMNALEFPKEEEKKK